MAIKDKLQKLLKKVTGKDIKGDNVEEVIADAEAKYEGGGTGGNIYRYTITYYKDSRNNVIDNVTILSSTNYDLGEYEVIVASDLPNISQRQLKALFDCAELYNYSLIETLDTTLYQNNTHIISSDTHGYGITDNNTSNYVVYIDIAYDETTNTYSFDTSYSQVIGIVSITKETI